MLFPFCVLIPAIREFDFFWHHGRNSEQIEHRTSNIERPILMTLRFIGFKTSESQNLPEADKFRRVDSLVQRRRLRRVLPSLFFKLTEYIIRCWTFDVRCSMFISFFFDIADPSGGQRFG